MAFYEALGSLPMGAGLHPMGAYENALVEEGSRAAQAAIDGKKMMMTTLIETVAEQLWQADSLRATGRKRRVPWREAPEQDHARFRGLASIAIKAINAYEAKPDTPAWQPIETAPTDGTEVLVFTRHKDVLFARFEAGEWLVLDPLLDCPWTEIVAGVLTHWMPLPNPPHLAFNEA